MKRLSWLSTAAVVSVGLLAACSQPNSTNSGAAESQYNPAAGRMGALAGIPDSDVPSGGVIPNLAPAVDASKLAAANIEASAMKTGARAYFVDHASVVRISSDDLRPPYVSGQPKATYTLDVPSQAIVRVESIPAGWVGIVFNLSQQKWVEGSPDNDHSNDQDVP